MKHVFRNIATFALLSVALFSTNCNCAFSESDSPNASYEKAAIALMERDYPAARAQLELAVQEAEKENNNQLKSDSLIALVRARYQQNDDASELISLLETAVELPDISDETRLGGYWLLVKLNHQIFRYAQARDYALKAVTLSNTRNHPVEQMVAINALCFAYEALGDTHDKAAFQQLHLISNSILKTPLQDHFDEIDIRSAANAYEREIFKQQAYGTLASIYSRDQRYDTAESLLKQALHSATKANNPKNTLFVLLGNIHAYAGDFAKSEEQFENALFGLNEETRLSYVDKGALELSVGLYYYGRGDLKTAKQHLAKALAYQPSELKRMDNVFLQALYYYQKSTIKEEPDYLTQSREKPNIWHADSKDIIVYLQKAPDAAGWKPEYDTMIKNAFSTWNGVLGDRFHFTFTDNPELYDVKISWHKQAKQIVVLQTKTMPWWSLVGMSFEKAGENTFISNQRHFIQNDINVYLHNSAGKHYPDHYIAHTILHEVGHCMGLKDHSPFPGDIMYEGGFNHLAPKALSERDITSLKTLYTLHPKHTNDTMRHVSQLYKTALSFNALIENVDY